MNLRSKLTYGNVVATLALFLVIGGGTVYAASELGKNDVKSKNIAKGAVKGNDLGKNAVTSPKIKDGTVASDDLTAGLLSSLKADVTGSASAGPVSGLTTATDQPLPLTGTTTFTPQEGEVAAIAAEAQFTVASNTAAVFCDPAVSLLVNGQPSRIFVSPDGDNNNTTPAQKLASDASGPFGLVNPGTPLTVTAFIRGDTDCTAATKLDELQVRIVQIK